ncbi:Indigoidine synthase A like protein-domain-containing protein [Kalaharituber pfeilii]|nr:Indigoidine synthase A like protein-domain-containing protein [Kalaharituber pfeilii]
MPLLRTLNKLATTALLRRHHGCRRGISVASSPLTKLYRVSEEVRAAVTARKPVVALESAIYTHGFPYPDNIELAKEVEAAVRRNGATPATICILDGVCRVGLTGEELVQLAESAGKKNTLKVSRRDIPYLTGMKLAGISFNGGTTIAGTMVLAELAGIKVFATGGLGGVHRGAEKTMDISADLTELGRTNIAVISSGSKAFLDLEKTLEYLETQGVLVSTFGKRGEKVDFPGFYSRSSGLLSPNVVETPKEAASIIYASHAMGLTSGQLFCNPIPTEFEIPKSEMADIISAAIKKAEKEGAKGKDNTPYILDRIKKDSKGRSIPANKALVLNNAQVGAEMAIALADVHTIPPEANESKTGFMPAISTHPVPPSPPEPSVSTTTTAAPTTSPEAPFSGALDDGKAELLIIGSVAVDYACDFLPTNLSGSPVPSLCTSNPSTITETIGGVAHNVFTAADLYLRSLPPRLVSSIADDLTGKWVLETLGKREVDISGIAVRDAKREEFATARYIAINDAKGGLFTAAADMRVVERMSGEHVRVEIERAGARWLCVDGNVSVDAIRAVIEGAKKVGTKVAFEPTSVQKSTRIFPELKPPGDSGPMLDVFPHNSVHLATPNEHELAAMYGCAREMGYFDSLDWFAVIDDINIDTLFRNSMEMLAEQAKLPLLVHGTLQQAIHLSPYLPTQLIKLGAHGVLAVRLLPVSPSNFLPTSPIHTPTILSHGRCAHTSGIYIRHFPALKVPEEEIISVNGVGDTFLGVVLARMVEVGVLGEKTMELAQRGAVVSLRSREAVGVGVARLRE